MAKNFDPNLIKVLPIDMRDAKRLARQFHYMRTAPSGAKLAFGIWYGDDKKIRGVCIFGKSSGTEAKLKLIGNGVQDGEIIEMQRLWIDDALGHNAESKTLSLIMKAFKEHYPKIKCVVTYAGGCKNDCGIVYQSSSFLYFGSQPCQDFYLTEAGEYKNIINVLRFGKAPKELKSNAEKAAYVYGPGKLLDTKRYLYLYPIEKRLRRKLSKKALPYPKDSENFRRGQEWVT